MLDFLVTNATLPDGRTGMSLAVQGGHFVEVALALVAPTRETLDAQGMLLCPPFVDAHFHLDATLSYGMPRVNRRGTLPRACWRFVPTRTPATRACRRNRHLPRPCCTWMGGRGRPHYRSDCKYFVDGSVSKL